MSEHVTVHGIEFIRHGACCQCGDCGCIECPHHEWRNGLMFCKIYDCRDEYCEECETDHASCIGYPDNPWIRRVRKGKCAYWFERADGGSMDELPFLDGKPYLDGNIDS